MLPKIDGHSESIFRPYSHVLRSKRWIELVHYYSAFPSNLVVLGDSFKVVLSLIMVDDVSGRLYPVSHVFSP